MKGVAERFWAKVDKTGTCWLWTGAKLPKGYGRIHGEVQGKFLLAHRVSYELANGPIPEGLVIDHMCHTPGCVNPDHLRAITRQQNAENIGKLHSKNTSGYRGVNWNKAMKKWHALVSYQRQRYHVGFYESIEDAAEAAKAKRLELHTHNDLDRAA